MAESNSSGRIVDDPIGFVDLNATILAAAGVKHPESDDPKLAPVRSQPFACPNQRQTRSC
jgi:arylsulfatase A-like enzyme